MTTALDTFSGTFQVFLGSTDVTTGHGVTYSVVTEVGCDATINSTTGVYTLSSVTSDSAHALLRAVHPLGYQVDKVFTVAKARAGQDGLGFTSKLMTLTATRQIFTYDTTGAASPSGQSVTFNAIRQNSSASVSWSMTDNAGVARTPLSSYLTVASDGLSATLSEAQFASARNGTAGVTVTAQMTDGTLFTDSVSVVRVADGAAGAAGANGLHNAQVYLYKRSASVPALPSSACTYTFASNSLTGITNGWTQAVPAANGQPCYVTVATASASTTTDTIAAAEWAAPVVLVQDGPTGAQGDAGLNSATVFLYQRAASQPAVPSVTTTYTFSTGVLSSVNNGWQQSVPTSNGNPCWITTASALSNTATDTIATAEWASPTVLVQDGSTGAPGANNATVQLYKRAASLPTKPSVSTTYTFSTGVLTGADNGWTQAVPATNGQPLYVTVATASSNAATDTIAAAEWATPVLIVQDGAAGGTGPAGTNTASIFLYQRAGSTPAVPSVTTTYTFSTGVLSGINNGWSQTVPTTNGQPCYVTTATALSTGSTDTIANTEWAAPTILAQDGANGGTGPAGPTIGLTASAGVFTFVDGLATNANQSITLTATRQNSSEVVNFTTSPAVTLTGSGLTRTLTLANFGSNLQVTITATGATSGASASVTIYRQDNSSPGDSVVPDTDWNWDFDPNDGVAPWRGGGGWRRTQIFCVTTDTVLPTHARADQVKVGDHLQIGNPLTFELREGLVTHAGVAPQPCVRITTKSGIQLECSERAPIAIIHGCCIDANMLLGHEVPVFDGEETRYEPVVRVEDIGERDVVFITCENDLFLAGKEEGRYLLHHNIKAQIP